MALRLGWFSTGRDRAAIDLFKLIYGAIEDGTIDAEMVFCFVNREDGEAPESDEFLATVRGNNVPVVTLSSVAFEPELRAAGRVEETKMKEWRLCFDRHVMRALDDQEVDLIVLAGYMLIVGPEMCRKFSMINLHPALPGGPTGSWQQVIRKLLARQAKRTGAMTHLVTPELDRGPVITYFSFEINDGFDQMRQDGVIRELPLILLTIKEFADGHLLIRDRHVFADGRELTAGYDLTEKVEAWLKVRGAAHG